MPTRCAACHPGSDRVFLHDHRRPRVRARRVVQTIATIAGDVRTTAALRIPPGRWDLRDGHAAERLDGAFVSANAFDMIAPRRFSVAACPTPTTHPGPRVAVLGRSGETRYGGDRPRSAAPYPQGTSVTLIGGCPTVRLPRDCGVSGWRCGKAQGWRPRSGMCARCRYSVGSRTDRRLTTRGGSRGIGIARHRTAGHQSKPSRRVVPINSRFLAIQRPGVGAFMTIGFIVSSSHAPTSPT